MIIRDPLPEDEAVWRRLWAAYNTFHDATVPDAVTERTWRRICDPQSTVFARFAEADGNVVGFSLSVLHEGTWTLTPICYLEDLYVDPASRGKGIGRRLIQDLVDLARDRGWSRLYWHTHRDNPARRLYDEFVGVDEVVRYRLLFG